MHDTSILVSVATDTVLAPAKINLALHVTGRRADGYHTLSSLVAFARYGDILSVRPASADSLAVGGPFAGDLAAFDRDDNLVVKALRLARRIGTAHGFEIGPLALSLDKRLPVASGVGGGSADAAALLRFLAVACPEIAEPLRSASVGLGADVPMCMAGVPATVAGIGEIGAPLAGLPDMLCLLVNPRVGIATSDVFRRLDRRDSPALPPVPYDGFGSIEALRDYLEATRNDLEGPAERIAPVIADIRAALLSGGALLARMSGSGATVFGLFQSEARLKAAADLFYARHPDWWTCATRLAGTTRDNGKTS